MIEIRGSNDPNGNTAYAWHAGDAMTAVRRGAAVLSAPGHPKAAESDATRFEWAGQGPLERWRRVVKWSGLDD
jgi:hypothetical protein